METDLFNNEQVKTWLLCDKDIKLEFISNVENAREDIEPNVISNVENSMEERPLS